MPVGVDISGVAVDLTDLIEDLQSEVSPPGQNLFPGATEAEWLSNLRNAFWEARLHGMLKGYVESDGLISPQSGTTDMPRDLQQLIILYAGYRIVLAAFRNARASFRAQAGPVSYETSTAATVLRDVLKAIKERINIVLTRLSDVGAGAEAAVFDGVIARTISIELGDTWWVR